MRQPDLDDVPKTVSMGGSRQFGWNAREHNSKDEELLDRVYKKVKSSVGQSWNETYSRLKPEVPARLQEYFEFWVPKAPRRWSWSKLYVDENGILREQKRGNRFRRKRKRTLPYILFNRKAYTTYKGFWWELDLRPWEDVKFKSTFYTMNDVAYVHYRATDIFWGTIDKSEASRYWSGNPYVCVSRRQCSGELSKKLEAYCLSKGLIREERP